MSILIGAAMFVTGNERPSCTLWGLASFTGSRHSSSSLCLWTPRIRSVMSFARRRIGDWHRIVFATTLAAGLKSISRSMHSAGSVGLLLCITSQIFSRSIARESFRPGSTLASLAVSEGGALYLLFRDCSSLLAATSE